jgi:ribosomal protein L22
MPKPPSDQIAALEREYAKLEAKLNETLLTDKDIVEEMHPKLGLLERATIKNLSNKDEGHPQNVEYLRQRHPELDVQSYNGRILVKAPGEEKYRTLDPDTGLLSSDILYDAADISGDVLRGVAETAAETAGAVGGALAGGIPGALVGRSITGGLSAAGIEALRQKLGQQMGIKQEVDPVDVAVSGGINAALPGAGALGRKAYGAATRKVAPWVGEVLSGVPSDVIQTTMKRLPEIDALDREGVTNISQRAFEKIATPLHEAVDAKGKQLATRIEDAGGLVNISQLRGELDDLLADYEKHKGQLDNEALRDSINQIKSVYAGLVKTPEKDVTEVIQGADVKKAAEILDTLNPKMRTVESKILDASGNPIQRPQWVVDEIPNKISPSAAWLLQKQVGAAADMNKLKPQAQMVSPRTAGESEAGKRLIGKLDTAYDAIGEGIENATSRPVTRTVTETPKQGLMDMIATRLGLKQAPEPITKTTVGVDSSATLKDEYRELANLRKRLQNHFRDEQQTYSTLTNLNKKSKRTLVDALNDAERLTGVDVRDEANLLRAHDLMGSPFGYAPSATGISSSGAVGTGRTMTAGFLGGALAEEAYKGLNEGEGGGKIPAALGFTLGAAAASPRGIKMGIRNMLRSEAAANALRGAAGGIPYGAMVRSPWYLMTNDRSSLVRPEDDFR